MKGIVTRFRRQPAWLALIIFLLLCLWLFSGISQQPEPEVKPQTKAAPITTVRTREVQAESVNREITLYGRSEPDRVATLRAEVVGRVLEIMVQEGESVSKGDALVKLHENDLRQQITAARATLQQRKMELEGAASLGQQGYQSKVTLAQAEAAVAQAEAALEALNVRLANTIIYAPFDGTLNRQFVEVGDLVREGDQIASVVDLDPLVIAANVTEQDIAQITTGMKATARLISGKRATGKVRYIASVSQQGTNTFPLEVEVANPDGSLKAGISSELVIPLQSTLAVRISPASMALDKDGNLGVKTVEQERVKFVPIDIVKSDADGVWLGGLGKHARIITLGHGFVNDGDKVNAVNIDSEL